jgi:hypothetical protein
MKRIKTYLTLTLAIAFCVSINTFAMEKERSEASGEWLDYQLGKSNTSSESGLEDGLSVLEQHINHLERMNNTINNMLNSNIKISWIARNNLKTLQEHVLATLATARDMLSGHIPTDTNLIHQQIKSISTQ